MLENFLTAAGLILIIEGILPFLNPRALRAALYKMAQNDDRTLRWMGLGSMVGGLFLLYLVK